MFSRSSYLAVIAAAAAAAGAYAGLPGSPAIGAVPVNATLTAGDEMPICHSRLSLDRPAVRLQRLAAMGDVLLAQAGPTEEEDTDLLEKLGLLEGHLLIGKALVDAGNVKDGLPHFGHPVAEIYDYIKPELDKRKVTDFYPQLRALEDQVRKVGGGAQTTAQYAEALSLVAKVRATVSDERRHSVKFMMGVIALLLEDTASDFGESIERGKISNKVEYHDAMGFSRYTDALLAELRTSAGPESADKIKKAGTEVAAVMKAFPSLDPPAKPPLTVKTLKASAVRVQALAK